MSVRQAQRACPDAAVLRADFALYRQVFEQFLDILAQYSPLVEPDTLGSAYLDVTASRALFGDAPQIAQRIIQEVSDNLQMQTRIGYAPNKLLARIGSICNHQSSICNLHIGALDAVSPRIEKRLRELGVTTVGQLARIPERLLVRQFGPVGSVLKRQAAGIDSTPVKAAYPPEIIIIEQTFCSPLEEPAEIEQYLARMASEAEMKLRKRHALAGEIVLRLQVTGYRLQGMNSLPPGGEGWGEGESVHLTPHAGISGVQSRNSLFHFKKPTDSAPHMLQQLTKLLRSKMTPGMSVTGCEIVLSDLVKGDGLQLSLIGESEQRIRLDRAVELIRERFGEGSIVFANSLAPTGRDRVLSRIAA